MTPYIDWACVAPTESCPVVAGTTAALPPKSHDTGASGSFGPSPLHIPFAPQPTTSTIDEIPATYWGANYTDAANVQAMFGGAQGLPAVIPEALPAGYDYDAAAAQAGLDEFINAL
jgi:hypothetical protein